MTINETIQQRWSELPEKTRQWALRTNRVRMVEVTVECTDATDWRSEWIDTAAWPTYTLELSVDGETVGEVEGWHFYHPEPADSEGGVGSLDGPQDSDGAYSGLPSVRDAEHDRIGAYRGDTQPALIDAGEHLSGQIELPLRASNGAHLIYDADQIEGAIQNAADQVDHGSDPELEDSADDRRPKLTTLHVIRDYQIQDVDVERLEQYQTSDYDDDDKCRYLVVAYRYDGEYYDSLAGAKSAVGDQYGGRCWRKEENARSALADQVAERIREVDPLPGMDCGIDAEGVLYVSPNDSEEIYHLDAEQTAAVCLHGWSAVLDDVVEAFGRRAALSALRSWQQEMDQLIVERDPWVSVEDSLAAGNCRAMTVVFRERMEQQLGAEAELGAVRASVILAARDDAYSRRACRQAASRTRSAA